MRWLLDVLFGKVEPETRYRWERECYCGAWVRVEGSSVEAIRQAQRVWDAVHADHDHREDEP